MTTLQAYAIPWLERKRREGLRAIGDYESTMRHHVLPHWSRVEIADIRPLAVRQWVDELRAKSLAPRTIRNIYGLLRNVLADAVADELIVANPCVLRGAALPPNEHRDPNFRDRHVFDQQEAQLIMDEGDPMWRALYTLLFASGVRIGEALALTWDDVELDAETPVINVAKSFNSKLATVGPTKTKVARKVPAHHRAVEALDGWRLTYARRVRAAPAGGRLVFPAPRGRSPTKHMRSSVVLNRFKRRLDDLGLERRRVHDCRRSFVSLACNAEGADTEILRRVTHARKGDVHDGYREVPVSVMAREVEKLEL